jgi:CheY-like chemotaxis protein
MKNSVNLKVLLVEDDEDKRQELNMFITRLLHCDVAEAKSYQSALTAIKSEHFDLILMDMSIPTFDVTPTDSGGRAQPFGGETLLFEMVRREIDTKVIVVTQFDKFGEGDKEVGWKDLDARLAEQFETNYLGAIQYGSSYEGWSDSLLNKINESGILE